MGRGPRGIWPGGFFGERPPTGLEGYPFMGVVCGIWISARRLLTSGGPPVVAISE